MNDKIKNIEEYKKSRGGWLSGFARCLQCGHVWVTAIEVKIGEWWFECPKCKTKKACFVYTVERDCGHWTCDCGSHIFHLTKYGPYCVICGTWHTDYFDNLELK
jgi:hypothetical protein